MLTGTVYKNLYECCAYGGLEYKQMLLDEAYYGKQKAKPIQDAMDAIANRCRKDPNWRVQDSKEASNLEKAFCKVFGFGRCSIYWRYTNPAMINQLFKTDFNSGSLTYPSLVLIPDTSAKSPDRYGSAKTGFYDSSHTIRCAICLDQAYFSNAVGMSSEEVVAIVLHEVGHNFDNTMFRLMNSWYMLSRDVIKLADIVKSSDYDPYIIGQATATIAIDSVAATGLLKMAPEYFVLIQNIDDILVSSFPPFAQVYRAVSNLAAGTLAIVRAVTTPLTLLNIITSLPRKLMTIPISKALDMLTEWFFANKAETYADSFAAQYGYGVEVNTALKKLTKSEAGEFDFLRKTPVDVVLRPFWDLCYLGDDVASALGGHGDSHERWKRTMATLDQDLAASGLSATDKKLILAEKARIQKEYDKFMKMDAERKMFATAVYRKAMDCWYHGNSHGFIKTIFADKTYAQ